MRSIRRGRTVVLVASVIAAVVCAAGAGLLLGNRSRATVRGVVVDPKGVPIPGATVTSGDVHAETDGAGRFRLEAGRGWVTVRARGWLPRTRAATPGRRVLVRLARDGPGTVTFAFGGDVMFGRRFFDPDEDGTPDGRLALDADVAAHRALLEGVAPALRDADLSVVNLETPLADDPYPDPRAPRPARFHPTKDYVFASLPAAARALSESGIDVVGIANNHLYDRLDAGVASTRGALQAAGFAPGRGFFGAGASPADAWRPAERTVDGQRVVFVGCTSITGEEHRLSYVAEPGKGGAAACSLPRVRREVAAAARRADIVVMMIHGGYEYERAPSAGVRALSDAAIAAGATMVIDHHPHVVGGLRFADGRLTAWTLGNLLFDQTVWPTFESYLLRVAVRGGRVVSAWLEPLRIQHSTPTGLFGDDATWVARGALARSQGPWAVDDGSLWLDAAGAARTTRRTEDAGQGAALDAGCSPRAGRDLLWTGDFEDEDVDPATAAPLWNVTGDDKDRAAIPAAAYAGRRGVRLRRSGADRDDMLLTPLHRILVRPGDDLTLLMRHRATRGPVTASLQLSWYNDTKGPSQERSLVDLPRTSDWQATRLDVRVPANAVAVQPFVRLAPPDFSLSVLDVDDVRLIDWREPGCEYLRGQATVVRRALPPATATTPAEPLPGTPTRLAAPAALPPGPAGAGE